MIEVQNLVERPPKIVETITAARVSTDFRPCIIGLPGNTLLQSVLSYVSVVIGTVMNVALMIVFITLI